ncbi:MAG: cupin domain-containing protein [bacterium]|jgi:hypothetical protein
MTPSENTPADPDDIEVSGPFAYVRIYTGPEGKTHFEDLEMTFELKDFAPPAPPISVSQAFMTQGMTVISSPGGWEGNWHPAPRRQFLIILVGELDVEVSDGEVRRFGPGSIILVEDTGGMGHISSVVAKERGYCLVLPLADD